MCNNENNNSKIGNNNFNSLGICFSEPNIKTDREEQIIIPDEIIRKNDCIILKTPSYVYDEFFFEVDYLNLHHLSPDNRYLVTYSLDYICIWDTQLILSSQKNNKVSKCINDLLKFFLYENKICKVKTNKNFVKMIYKNDKFISVAFKSNNEFYIAFGIGKIVEIYSLTIKEDITFAPDVRPIANITLFDANISCFVLSNSTNSLATLSVFNEEYSILSVYDTSKMRSRVAAPYGHLKYQKKSILKAENCNRSYVSSDFSESYVGNHIDLDLDLDEESEVGERSNPFTYIHFSEDDNFIGICDFFKKFKNKDILYRYDGFTEYEEFGRLGIKNNYVKILSVSTDNNFICTGNDSSDICVYSIQNSTLIFKISIDSERKTGISSIGWSKDSTRIGYGTTEGSIGVIDSSDGSVIKKLTYDNFTNKYSELSVKKYITKISFCGDALCASIMFDQKNKDNLDFSVLINI